MKTLKVKLTFTEPLLGTWPANPNVAQHCVATAKVQLRTAKHRFDRIFL